MGYAPLEKLGNLDRSWFVWTGPHSRAKHVATYQIPFCTPNYASTSTTEQLLLSIIYIAMYYIYAYLALNERNSCGPSPRLMIIS